MRMHHILFDAVHVTSMWLIINNALSVDKCMLAESAIPFHLFAHPGCMAKRSESQIKGRPLSDKGLICMLHRLSMYFESNLVDP